jgi:AP endonuclease-2
MNESTTARATQSTEPPLGTPAASTCHPLVSSSPSKPVHDDTVIDPIVSKEDWSKLFTKKPVPRCDSHEEPCISLTTKKPGINRGRAFWICPRPLGPHGEKEKGTQWRCPTFIWASDWNGSSQPES